MFNYNNKRFRVISNVVEGEVGSDTTLHYQQNGQIVTGTYSGGDIIRGQLIALCNEHGELDMRYQHINRKGELLTGTCHSIPEVLSSGLIRLHETWQWTSGKEGSGTSIIEEISEP